MKKHVVVNGALEVTENVLHNSEMWLTMVIHVKAHLLDYVGDVRPGEGEVLEYPSQAAGGSGVIVFKASVKRRLSDA
jgi:hypothetical protein